MIKRTQNCILVNPIKRHQQSKSDGDFWDNLYNINFVNRRDLLAGVYINSLEMAKKLKKQYTNVVAGYQLCRNCNEEQVKTLKKMLKVKTKLVFTEVIKLNKKLQQKLLNTLT